MAGEGSGLGRVGEYQGWSVRRTIERGLRPLLNEGGEVSIFHDPCLQETGVWVWTKSLREWSASVRWNASNVEVDAAIAKVIADVEMNRTLEMCPRTTTTS